MRVLISSNGEAGALDPSNHFHAADWKIVRKKAKELYGLYDLAHDVKESTNVAAEITRTSSSVSPRSPKSSTHGHEKMNPSRP